MHALRLSLSVYVLSWQHLLSGDFERARKGVVLALTVLLRCVSDLSGAFLRRRPSMGFYIEDRGGETKEKFLSRYGRTISDGDTKSLFRDFQELPVCISDNGDFSAAVICYNEREVDRIQAGIGDRMYAWFAVPRDKLCEDCPELKIQLDWGQVEGGTVE